MSPRLVDAKELADYIGSTPKSIYTLKCQGKLPKQWIVPLGSKAVRFDLVEVDKSIEASKSSDEGLDSIFKVQA